MKVEVTQTVNGVDVGRLQETVRNVKASPELARFRFQIENRWIRGGENRSLVNTFDHAGEPVAHKSSFALVADEPEILLGADKGANPVEHLLHALASCMTTSMVYHAAARGIEIEQVESTVSGDLDLRGFLGLDPTIRNGYQQIQIKLRIKARGKEEELQELGRLGPTFSPVYDSIFRGVPVAVSTERIS